MLFTCNDLLVMVTGSHKMLYSEGARDDNSITMKVRNPELFVIHADYCRVLANSKRLMIMACLDRREMSVGELAETIESPLSTVSQHLSVLKNKQLVKSRKEGQTVIYSPTDRRIMDACRIIRTVLIDGMKRRGEIAHEIDPKGVIEE
jgi:DNA-binding transcriptional ArsR family regulator